MFSRVYLIVEHNWDGFIVLKATLDKTRAEELLAELLAKRRAVVKANPAKFDLYTVMNADTADFGYEILEQDLV